MAVLTLGQPLHDSRQIHWFRVLLRDGTAFPLPSEIVIRFFGLIVEQYLLCREGQINTRLNETVAGLFQYLIVRSHYIGSQW